MTNTKQNNQPILSVKNLALGFQTDRGFLTAVDDVSFNVLPGETLGIVGESGCGKSVSSMAIMGLLPQPAGKITQGEILFEGKDLIKASSEHMYHVRGNQIGMIFQEPMTALNPVHTIRKQLGEAFRLHHPDMSEKDIFDQSIDMLKKVGIPAPEFRIFDYPHQLSGGMRQRAMIAIALACKPELLIADEPTTALDVTIQAQILDLLKSLQEELKMAMIFITHDLGVVANVCDRVLVMYAGRTVEIADTKTIFHAPKHPYTQGLLGSLPSFKTKAKAKLPTIEGQVPGLANMPAGCRFADRCDYVQDQCRSSAPKLEAISSEHQIRCVRWKEISK